MKTVLTIAGSDCSGGAGIQADLKTITAHAMYGMSAITALTVQNTIGVFDVMDVPPEFAGKQLDAIFTDIVPDAIKIGMVSNQEIISMIAQKLRHYGAKNIVADPVMVATSGGSLIKPDSIDAMKSQLLPLASVVTPNIPEARLLSGISIESHDDMERAAQIIAQATDAAVVLKGGHLGDFAEARKRGHLGDSADDLLYDHGLSIWIKGKRIQTKNTHGTGCTLSSAIACGLAAGLSLEESVRHAKKYVTKAIETSPNLGSGNGSINHCYAIPSGFSKSSGHPVSP